MIYMSFRKVRVLTLTFFYLFSAHGCLYSVVVGSYTSASRPGHVVFPEVDSDNEMRGFASFDKGFWIL